MLFFFGTTIIVEKKNSFLGLKFCIWYIDVMQQVSLLQMSEIIENFLVIFIVLIFIISNKFNFFYIFFIFFVLFVIMPYTEEDFKELQHIIDTCKSATLKADFMSLSEKIKMQLEVSFFFLLFYYHSFIWIFLKIPFFKDYVFIYVFVLCFFF